ncbi:unnamed protein product [Lactuca saligna]|uniref:Uncharacterized protein n=1 Tax=Lactuca saligna TaxID=75948 RepID=A0AA35ZJ51_LACSI|nr:unnamed protein product [Lactuca saligna]
MGVWRRGVVVGRSSGGRRKKKPVMVVFKINDNRKSMERKLRQLQRIIPGGGVEGIDMETLFQRIAAHISLLESRLAEHPYFPEGTPVTLADLSEEEYHSEDDEDDPEEVNESNDEGILQDAEEIDDDGPIEDKERFNGEEPTPPTLLSSPSKPYL